MQITRLINYTPINLKGCGNPYQNSLPKYNNVNGSTQYPGFNKSLDRDTVCFTSNNSEYKYYEKMNYDMTFRMEQRYGYDMGFHSISGYLEALKQFDVKEYVGLGMESAVFELNDGNILKLSCEQYTPYNPEFHAPEIDRGIVKLAEKHTAMDKSYNTFNTDEIYYVIQKKGELAQEESETSDICDKARKKGLFASDIFPDQFAYFDTPNGRELKCIDLGCITDRDYPIQRKFGTIDKMRPDDVCRRYGMLFNTLELYYKNVFGRDEDKINDFLQQIKPRVVAGEKVSDIVKELLKEDK